MNRAETAVRRIDRFQQRHAILAVPFAVVQKFGNDQAGGKATIIAFYGLFAVFPLLLLFSTILGFVLAGHPELEQRMINSALADFPILGTQLRSSTHPLRGNGWALVLGVLGALYGAQGIGQAAQNAMNTVWNVPFKGLARVRRPPDPGTDDPGAARDRDPGLDHPDRIRTPLRPPVRRLDLGYCCRGQLSRLPRVLHGADLGDRAGAGRGRRGRWSPPRSGRSCNASGTGSSGTPSATPPTCTDSSPSSSACCPGCTSVPG